MKVGVFVDVGDEGRGVPAYPEIRARARQAEALGLDSIWVADHLVFRFDGATLGTHECWTVLAALAEATERITLGTMVICTSFRNPALLAKMAATLDHVSGGRLVLGLGCGWHDPEYEAFGFPADRKVDRFEEAIGIVSALVRTGRADVEGQWTQLRDCVLVPPARPDLPLLVAARKPRNLDLTARYADSWNVAWFGAPDERLPAARAALAEACARVGRDPAEIEVTAGITVRYDGATGDASMPALQGTPEEIAAGLLAHAAGGVDHATVALDPLSEETLAAFGDAVAIVRATAANGGAAGG